MAEVLHSLTMRRRLQILWATGVIATVSGALALSHEEKKHAIEVRCKMTRGEAQGTFDDDVSTIREQVGRRIRKYGGGLEFVTGDFGIRRGASGPQARCGGMARAVCEEGSKLGFDSEIRLEAHLHRMGLHYYATLSRREGDRVRSIRMDGDPENIRVRELRQ